MPAQLIVIAKKKQEKRAEPKEDKKEEKKSAASPAGGDQEPIYPPHIPIPVGTLAIFGQKPLQLGHFKTVGDLMEEVQSWNKLPGGSNTVFATVANLNDLKFPSIHERIAKLPKELTIVVHEGETLA